MKPPTINHQLESSPLPMLPMSIAKLSITLKNSDPVKFDKTCAVLKELMFSKETESFIGSKKTQAAAQKQAVEMKKALDEVIEKSDWPIDEAVPLKSAKARRIGQLVAGTSSSYRVVAYGEKFALAARKAGSKVSLRVEGSLTDPEVAEFASLGVSKKGAYLSGHLELGEVPMYRVFGVLFFNPKLKFVRKMVDLKEAKL